MPLLVCCPAAYGKDGQQYSLLEYILRETEQLHGSVRRYTSPDEQAFYPGVYHATTVQWGGVGEGGTSCGTQCSWMCTADNAVVSHTGQWWVGGCHTQCSGMWVSKHT